MITVVMDRPVSGSPDQVWAVIDDVERMSEWFAFADRAELIEGSGLGRRQRTHGTWSGKAAEVDQEVTLYEPGRAIGWRHLEERLDGRPAPKFAEEVVFCVRLEEEPGGTRVTMESRQRPVGFLKGVLIRLVGLVQIRTQMKRSLDRLESIAAAELCAGVRTG
ncbi:MAG: SRPBCC family protein [Chloroflexi bacterium]|nr:SRPBCC family protein [Chloroflexota bacterium]MCY3939140.1 SRPBCC family protein [Chloroflexota bacterium]